MSADDVSELKFQLGQVARLRAHRNLARDEYGEALQTIKKVENLIATAKDLGRPDRVLTSEETAWLLKVRKVCEYYDSRPTL